MAALDQMRAAERETEYRDQQSTAALQQQEGKQNALKR
jgi:hypothetical protein